MLVVGRKLASKAFTLVEILIVVTIIIALSAITVGVYSYSKTSAKEALCITHLEQLERAFQLYAADSDDYPPPYVSVDVTTNESMPGTGKKLIASLAPYGATMAIWRCPFFRPNWESGYPFPLPEGYYIIPTWTASRYLANRFGTVFRIKPLSAMPPNMVHLADPFYDILSGGRGPGGQGYPFVSTHGSNRANVVYFDGHAESTTIDPG